MIEFLLFPLERGDGKPQRRSRNESLRSLLICVGQSYVKYPHPGSEFTFFSTENLGYWKHPVAKDLRTEVKCEVVFVTIRHVLCDALHNCLRSKLVVCGQRQRCYTLADTAELCCFNMSRMSHV